MNELLKRILDILLTKEVGVVPKILISFAAVFVFVYIVDVSGVLAASESRRLSNIALMGQILSDHTLTTQERSLLMTSRKSAIYRRSLSERVNDFVSDVLHPSKNIGTRITKSTVHSDSTMQAPADLTGNTMRANSNAKNTFTCRNNALFFISVNFWLILIYTIFFVSLAAVGIFDKSHSPILRMIVSEVLLFVICAPLSILLYWLFGLAFTCPFFGQWWVTYITAAVASAIVPTSLWFFVLKH
jgi:hypothetical protein